MFKKAASVSALKNPYMIVCVESVPELVSTISIPDGILLLIIASHLRSDDFQFKRFSGSYC